ncbi:non-ribosomal peptide synthetase, partial [Longimicrobium sp.]|uniref:non-ribosomal peptide synthetase n=1 Tax=Longimicrobium sp. TaxID=2029185 RepID=UPI002E349FF8
MSHAPGGSAAHLPGSRAERSGLPRTPGPSAGDAADGGARAPLSFAQQRLWFLEQLEALGSAYHLSRFLRLRGALDEGAVARALGQVVARHAALRTTFHEAGGVPEQRIAPAADAPFPLVVEDLGGHADPGAELRRRMAEAVAAPFDLRRGPLLRGVLFRLAPGDHLLLLTLHHIVSDAWSLRVLAEDFGALYAGQVRGGGEPLSPLPVPYEAYLARQARERAPELVEPKKAYWRTALAGAPPLLELPTDHPRPARQRFGGSAVPVCLDEALTARVKALAARHDTTLFRTVLAAWALVAARLSGQDDVVVGVPMANRDPQAAGGLVGFFVDTVVVRVDLSGSPTAGDLLRRVHARTREARRHREVPFEEVVSLVAPVRSRAYHPLYQTTVTWHDVAQARLSLPGLAPAALEAPPLLDATVDTSLVLHEEDGRVVGRLEYATALFEQATAERFAGYLRRALEEMTADEHRSVDRLPLLSGAERAHVVDGLNATDAPYPADRCIHELFQAQVARTPAAIAVSDEGERVTYAALNARANRLAHHLRRRGVGPEVRVGLCMERGVEMVVSLLAILKAGGAWVPLDPAHPAERLERMLADSGAAVLLTQDRLRARLPAGAGARVVCVDAEGAAIGAEPAHDPESGATPGGLAYVIYTSGSTGTPKGVGIEHRALVNHMAWFVRDFGLTEADRVLQKTPVVFDASVWEFHAPLLVGGELVMARHEGERDPRYLARTLRDRGITVLQLVPSLLRVLLDEPELGACTALRHLFCGGEPLPGELARRAAQVLPGARVTNLYGPAECCIDTSTHRCTGADGARAVVPIGRPVPNTRAYVLDAALR